MIRKTLLRAMTMLIVLSMAVPFAQAAPATQSPPPPIGERAEAIEWVEELAAGPAMSKIDPLLRDAAEQGGKELVDLYVTVMAGTDLSQYMSNMIVRPVIFSGIQNVYGQTAASNLLKIAQRPDVAALVMIGDEMQNKPYDPEQADAPVPAPNQARLEALRANELTYAEAQAKAGDVEPQDWFDVHNGHKAVEAWEKGFTGAGVLVAVADDGVDFAHPDLQGMTGRVTDPDSPYYGWPMAFSQISARYFAQEVLYQDQGAQGITLGWNGSRWVDAQTTITPTANTVMYQTLGMTAPHVYTIPTTSQSGVYKLSSHPDRWLLGFYGARVAVLVVDEHQAGVYDTVYADLDGDYDFTDEKPATKSSPELYRDMDGDGYADLSGGQLVWISDGVNTPPVVDWLWGIECGDEVGTLKACPDSGELVLFSGPFEISATGSHGTLCASNVAGQGVVAGGLSAPSFRVGGMVQGAAPEVGVVDFGNHYFTGTAEDERLVAALGYDGVVNSGDEIQITSNSYGASGAYWGGWSYLSRLEAAVNILLSPDTLWVNSAGNGGPGYGPQEGYGSPTALNVGSSTQYGSTNWDSIVSADQIMYGDPNAYYSHGPSRDGAAGVDVLANGGRGAGDDNLNYVLDGATAWETWGGTSRSTPFAAGAAALVYQAYKARYGEWPTWDVAKALIKSGATNSVGSPFLQGSGLLNADRATDLAAGIYGVYATPDEWQVGDWEGEQYASFAKVAYPGDTFTQTYTVYNPSGHNITVGLTDGVMTLITKTQMTFTTSDEDEESAFNFYSPDYLMQLDNSLIPADAEVMIVRYGHTYDTFDSNYDYSATANSGWRFLLYNWTDVNGDGQLWVDANGNGAVNHVDDVDAGLDNDAFFRLDFTNPISTEIQMGEYIRVDYDFGGLNTQFFVRDPLERMADGYFFGWQHRNNDGSVPTTTFQIGLEFYKRADWDWLSLSNNTLAVPAEGEANFEAQMALPMNAAPGAYEGVIFMNDPGDSRHDAHETILPVVVNVIADLPDGESVTLGGDPEMADTMYQNSWTYGYFNLTGDWQTAAGDWRHYFLNVSEADVAADNLLIHASWVTTPTDINTWVLGPTPDCAANGTGQCATFGGGNWSALGLGLMPWPAIFGPYTLAPLNAHPTVAGSVYPFLTSTGGPDDWTKIELESAGLHQIALHNLLYSGEALAEPFQVDVGTLNFGLAMDPAEGVVGMGSVNATAYVETGEIEFQFTPSIEIPDLEATLAGGLVTDNSPQTPITVLQSQPIATFSPWLQYVVTDTFTLADPGTTHLRIYLDCPTGGDDPDLFLIYDTNGDGQFTQADGIYAQDGSSSGGGCSELIEVDDPALGDYAIFVDGYSIGDQVPGVSAMPTYWQYWWTHPGDLPTDPVEVFSDTITVNGTDPGDYTTASFSTTVTMPNHAAALHTTLTGIDPLDADLYVTDESGALVGSSVTDDVADEMVTVTPPGEAYRFEEGAEYTVWVHTPGGTAVYPADVHLNITLDELNVWLSATHPDVHAAAIDPGEMVSVTLHFDKQGWSVGDPDLSARFIAGPSVLPDAFDELVTITRDDPPVLAPDADTSKMVTSARGLYPTMVESPYGYGAGYLALAGPGELVTYTVAVTNTGDAPGTYYIEDYWGASSFTFQNFVVAPAYYGFYGAPGWTVMWITDTLAPGESLEFTYVNQVAADVPLGYYFSNYVDVYDYDTGVPYDTAKGAWAGVLYRSFMTTGSYKMAPAAVLAGDGFTYNIRLANPSAEDRHVYFADPLPDEVEFVSVTGSATYDTNTHTVSWDGMLDGTTLSTVDFDIVVTARDTLTYSTVIQNQAVITSAQPPGGTLVPAGMLTAQTVVGTAADLAIEKSVDAIEGIVGDTLNYTVVFGNNGAERAVGVLMEDVVPAYLTVATDTLTATLPGVAYNGGLMRWTGNLDAGAEVTVTFQAAINDTATEGLALINAATVEATNFPWRQYDSALTEIYGMQYIYLPLVMRNF